MEDIFSNLLPWLTVFLKNYGVDLGIVVGVGGNVVTLTQRLKKQYGWRGRPVMYLCAALCLPFTVLSWLTVNQVAHLPGHDDYIHLAKITGATIVWGILTGKWQSLAKDNRPDDEATNPTDDTPGTIVPGTENTPDDTAQDTPLHHP